MWARLTLFGFILAIAFPVAAIPSSRAADPDSFEVMGLRLGMTASEVETVADENGFDIAGRDLAPSFEQAVAQRRGQRIDGNSYSGVNKIRLVRDDARVEAFFAATPKGPRLYQVAANVFEADNDVALAKEIIAKYGEPDERGEREWLWGDTGAFYMRSEPYLEFQPKPVSATRPPPVGRIILADPALQKDSQKAIADEAAKDS